MDINALPAGDNTLVDSNVIIYYLGGLSVQCRDFFYRVARRDVIAHVTTTIIAEVLHRRMMAEAVAKGLISPGQTVKKLKADPAVIPLLTDHIAEVEKLLRLPFRIHQVTRGDIIASHALRQTHGLFVNDSINLACAHRLALTSIVTNDSDFNRKVVSVSSVLRMRRWDNPVKVVDAVIELEQKVGQNSVKLSPGMTATGQVEIESVTNVLLAPIKAVREKSGQVIVNVPGNDVRSEERAIRVGRKNQQFVEVLEGLREGEKVIL